jgi:hypothetical protein
MMILIAPKLHDELRLLVGEGMDKWVGVRCPTAIIATAQRAVSILILGVLKGASAHTSAAHNKRDEGEAELVISCYLIWSDLG